MSINLRTLRKLNNITRVQMAKDLGVNVRTITRWEQNGVETMTLKNAKKLANYFNKSLDELFGD
ncbi:TPA: helix-turn-helix transcriptional regulator [Streptococcus agalactiae]|nr:helix-turn-helix transcriptional regulator [Streptococcus agalactiae]